MYKKLKFYKKLFEQTIYNKFKTTLLKTGALQFLTLLPKFSPAVDPVVDPVVVVNTVVVDTVVVVSACVNSLIFNTLTLLKKGCSIVTFLFKEKFSIQQKNRQDAK